MTNGMRAAIGVGVAIGLIPVAFIVWVAGQIARAVVSDHELDDDELDEFDEGDDQ